MTEPFRIGISEDFYTEAASHAEFVCREKFGGLDGFVFEKLPQDGDKFARAEDLDRFDAIFALATKITPESLRGVKRLAIVARWGVGYDRIDVPALTEADIVLAITPNSVRGPVAEAILTLIFALAKNLPLQDRVIRGGGWRGNLPRLGISVAGRTLGSIGCGNIGQEMFRMAQSIGFGRFIACDPHVSPERVKHLGVELTDMDTIFRESDFVTVNTLLNANTRGLIGESHFRLMKPSAFFINTARGPIVQHEALVRALRENWIAGAGIDVFPTEPPPKDDPLFALENCIVAPHALAWTNELMRENGFEASDNVLAVARGQAPNSPVNRDVLSRPGFQAKLERYRR